MVYFWKNFFKKLILKSAYDLKAFKIPSSQSVKNNVTLILALE